MIIKKYSVRCWFFLRNIQPGKGVPVCHFPRREPRMDSTSRRKRNRADERIWKMWTDGRGRFLWRGCWWEPGTGGVAGVCRSGMFTESFSVALYLWAGSTSMEALSPLWTQGERTQREDTLSTWWAPTCMRTNLCEDNNAHTDRHTLSCLFYFLVFLMSFFCKPTHVSLPFFNLMDLPLCYSFTINCMDLEKFHPTGPCCESFALHAFWLYNRHFFKALKSVCALILERQC